MLRSTMRGSAVLLLAMAALVAGGTTARAQFYDGPAYAWPVPDMVGPLITGQSMESYIRRGQQGKKTATPAPAATDLRLGSDLAVSREVKAAFFNQLLRDNPTERARIDAVREQDWLTGYRDEIARPNGLEEDNLADALTAYLIAAWAIVHKETTIQPAAITAVRDRMRAGLGESPALAQSTAEDRQSIGEDLIYRTVLIMANRTEIARTGDNTMAEAAARHYRDAVMAGMQIDFSALDLTRRGFVAK